MPRHLYVVADADDQNLQNYDRDLILRALHAKQGRFPAFRAIPFSILENVRSGNDSDLLREALGNDPIDPYERRGNMRAAANWALCEGLIGSVLNTPTDRDLTAAALRTNGLALERFSSAVQDDREMVLAAVYAPRVSSNNFFF